MTIHYLMIEIFWVGIDPHTDRPLIAALANSVRALSLWRTCVLRINTRMVPSIENREKVIEHIAAFFAHSRGSMHGPLRLGSGSGFIC